jgi:isovaleryl-CoA dehydrogenase
MNEILELASKKAFEMDLKDEMDKVLLDSAFESKLMAVTVPKELGGMGEGYAKLCEVVEAFGKVNSGFALTLTAHHMTINCIRMFGHEDWLKRLTKSVGAFAITEPHAGSDVSAVKLRAERKGDYFVLNGNKTLITNATFAEVFVVLAKVEDKPTAFVVERCDGIETRKLELCGMRGSGIASVRFRDVEVPAENVLLDVGKGLKVALSTLSKSRVVFSALGLGIAERCLELAVKYAKEREAFGKKIAEFQGIQWMLAEVASEIEAVRRLIYHTANLADNGEDVTKFSAMCKLLIAKVAKKSADVAVEVFGGHGLIRGSPVERAYRDVKALDIGEGTSEIMKMIVSRFVLS